MKKTSLILLALGSSITMADNALIGIYCQENTNGVKVYVNDELKFECSDFAREAVVLEEGSYQVKAVQSISKEQEKVFSQQVDATSNRPQRVRITMPQQASLTAYGLAMKKQRDAEAARKLALENERLAKQALEDDWAKAGQGDLAAMQRMIGRYESGDGVEKSQEQAEYWQRQYTVQKAQKDRLAKIESLEKALDENPYFYFLNSFPRAIQNSDASESSTLMTGLPLFTFSDIISSPTVYSDRKDIQERLDAIEGHAVRWAKPDSMVAKASQ
ncbi:hypothetical protein [Marinomonas posidonica]|uniref:hypothetical protein n=1 Tax=Marinomonas posidonica TaxID=936476 RepID=UPI00373520E8